MTQVILRVRMFAGPNGSGRSTIRSLIRPELIGVCINPDEIQDQLKRTGRLDLSRNGIEATSQEVLKFFSQSVLIEQAGLTGVISQEVVPGCSSR